MTISRGEIWIAQHDPIQGSEQGGTRPVLVLQDNSVGKFTTTVIAVPLTTNLRRAALPTCVRVYKGEGGLRDDSAALCHQIRALDRTRLKSKLGKVSKAVIEEIEDCMLYTLGIP